MDYSVLILFQGMGENELGGGVLAIKWFCRRDRHCQLVPIMLPEKTCVTLGRRLVDFHPTIDEKLEKATT